MFPIALDLTKIPIVLVGRGELLKRRHAQLQEYGAAQVTVFENAFPARADIENAMVVMAAGLSREESETVAASAHAAGKLVNIEDVSDLCDFYFTANLRRGDLLIAVSTGGASPTLARKIRDTIARMFGEEWKARTEELAKQRLAWKAAGKTMKETADASEEYITERGWLP